MVFNFLMPFLLALYGIMMPFPHQQVEKNGMTVKWHFSNNQIHFKMCAPTQGWITIGFNEKDNLEGAYLLMGHVVNQSPNVVEHYTIHPGNYRPITTFGESSNVENIEGKQTSKYTMLSFSLPLNTISKYQKHLGKGKAYQMILAYSMHNDFQHHSVMRTSVKVQL